MNNDKSVTFGPVPSHCTGIDAFAGLKYVFGNKCVFGRAGKEIYL